MMATLIEQIEKNHKKKKIPAFSVGDNVKIHTKIVEGDKERVQIFQGVVIARKGSGLSETFTVNRVAFGYANEKVFPLHSPTIMNIEVVQKGDVRKAKLSYIRGKLGRAAKISTKFGGLEEVDMEEEAEDGAASSIAGSAENPAAENPENQ
jgi:large subunit ribosomal protein L19